MSVPLNFLSIHISLSSAFWKAPACTQAGRKGLCDAIRQYLVFLFTAASSVLSYGLSGQILLVVVQYLVINILINTFLYLVESDSYYTSTPENLKDCTVPDSSCPSRQRGAWFLEVKN